MNGGHVRRAYGTRQRVDGGQTIQSVHARGVQEVVEPARELSCHFARLEDRLGGDGGRNEVVLAIDWVDDVELTQECPH